MLFEDCRLFIKQKKAVAVYLSFLLIMIFMIVRVIIIRNSGLDYSHYKNYYFTVDTFLYMLDMGKIFFLFFVVFSLYMFMKNTKDGINELISVYSNRKGYATVSKAFLLILLTFTASFIFIATHIMYVFITQKNIIIEYLLFICKLWLIYIVLPNILAILFGLLFSKIKRTKIQILSVILLIYVFCGNFVSLMHAASRTVNIPYKIGDFFSIFVRGNQKAHDLYYLVSAEINNPIKHIFLCSLVILVCLLISNLKRKKVLICILTPISITLFIFSVCPNSSVYSDNEPGSTFDSWMAPQYYYDIHQTKNEQADFIVQEYELKLSLGYNTKYEVVITPDKKDLDEYKFTLYHEYSIDSISDNYGNPLDYERDGDYLVISSDSKELTKLNIQYSGNSSLYYSSVQGVYLPTYIPYYPIPGYYAVFEKKESNTEEWFNKQPKLNVAHYKIKIKGNKKVYCSLPQSGQLEYEGDASGVTILGSNFAREISYNENNLVYSILEIDEQEALNALARYDKNKTENDPTVVFLVPYNMYGNNYKDSDILMLTYDRFQAEDYLEQ